MGRIEKILDFEGLQELHYGFGYASAFIPFLQAFKDSDKFTIFAYKKTNPYTQKGILPIEIECVLLLYILFHKRIRIIRRRIEILFDGAHRHPTDQIPHTSGFVIGA